MAASVGPELSPSSWTRRRKEIFAFLQANAPPLAELYEAAIVLLEAKRPGRLRLVAHSVREIGNRLPDYLGGRPDRGRVDYRLHLDGLVDRCGEVGLAFDNRDGEEATPDAGMVQIPVAVYRQLGSLLREHASATARSDETSIRLFTLTAPESGPHVSALRPAFKHWKDCQAWFVSVVHDPGPRQTQETRVAKDAELEVRFEVFESVLFSLVGSFYQNVSELDDILGDANRRSD